MTEIEVMQAAFMDELEKIADSKKKELTGGEKALAVIGGGPAGYLGARKAREHGHSALEGGIRGWGGGMLGAGFGATAGSALGHAVGGEAGGALGSALGGVAGGLGGYKALTHAVGKDKK